MGSKRNIGTRSAVAQCAAAPVKRHNASILSRLGVFGLQHIEPVILGALISGEPLLLIGPHGTGKSYLLNRLCQALGLVSRHYNASLLNFDDLVGYPLPNERRELEYVQTPASIWGAQAVFMDEISRCRPDLQNKLFPIIYERRVQGLLLEELEYRWAAMNPPASEDLDDLDTGTAYLGSEPLDPALADRFALILPLPEFKDYSETDQVNVILKADGAIPADAAAELRRIVASGRSVAKTLQEEQGPVLAEYVREVVLRLGQAGVTCSPRRAAILLRNVAAVHAAQLVLGGSPRLQDSAWLAVRFGLPVTAAGQKLSEMRVLAAHKETWSQISIPKKSPLRLVMQEQDPLRRVLLACRLDELSRSDFSVLVADVLAELRPGARHAVAALLFEEDRAGKLSAAVAEEAAELYLTVCTPQDVNSEVRTDGLAYRMYTAITKILSEIPAEEPETLLMTNLLLGLWKAEEIASEEQVRDIVNDWQTTRRQFGRGAE